MTDDTNGPAPHDPESDDNFAREPAAAETETWQGGAPEDDFSDDAVASETATVSEETDHPPVDTDGGNPPENGKKRNMFLPVTAAAGGILLLGVLAYWQFGDSMHGDQQPTPMAITDAFNKPKPSITEKTAPPLTAEMVAPKTDMAPVPAEPVSPINVSPRESTTIAVAPPVAVAAALPVMAAAAPPTPTVPATNALPPAAAVTIVPVAVKTDNGAADSRLAALSLRVEDLQKSLDQATQQLSLISSKLAADQTAGAAPQPNPIVEERLNGIEQKLMQMQHAAPSVEVTAYEPAPTPHIAMPAMHAPRKTVHHKAVRKTASTHSSKTAAKVSWVLRAASPNEVWIAKDFSSQDLQPVHVGDTLPGIGRVNAIRDDNGAWVVDGAKGTIR